LAEFAALLQHNFEVRFAHVDFEPLDNPLLHDAFAGEEDSMINGLMAAQTRVLNIQENVTSLLSDLLRMRKRDLKMRHAGRGKKPAVAAAASKRKRAPNDASVSPAKKRNRKPATSTPGRKPRAPPKAKGATPSSFVTADASAPLSHEESMALRAEIAHLDEEQQQEIVQIMVSNQERLTQDSNGYTEIDLGSCSSKTVRQIQQYIQRVRPKRQEQQQQQQNSQGSDSDSDSSEDEEDDSSSSSSSGSESD